MPPSGPGGRQTMMFSATWPAGRFNNVRQIADSFLVNPAMLTVGRVGGAAESVTQKVAYVEGRHKTDAAVELLREVPGKTIVFVNTKRAAEDLEDYTHRIGRTGRAGNRGLATTFLSADNKNIAHDLAGMLTSSKAEVPEWLIEMAPRRGGRGRGRGRGRGGRGRGYRGGRGGYRSGGGYRG